MPAGVISTSQALAIFSPLFAPPLLTFSTRCDRLSANAASGDEGGTAPRPWLRSPTDRATEEWQTGMRGASERADGSRAAVIPFLSSSASSSPFLSPNALETVGPRSVGRSLVRLWRRVPFLPQDK